jgi:uncharacterized protein (DUF4415 family)
MTKKSKTFDPDEPIVTDEMWDTAQPFHKLFPQFRAADEAAAQKRARGRPVAEDPLVNISIRVHQSTLPKLRAKRGYQTQITRLVEDFARA